MGSHHIRVYQELQCAELVEVVEPNLERAKEVREEHDIPVRSGVEEITEARAASIAVPNAYHRNVAETAIEMGLDVLVEKPLAETPAQARSIIDTAKEHDAVLQVGHIERFNPAVKTLEQILEDRDLVEVEAHRLGPFHEHLADENVVFDLMIHDIDILRHLVPGEIVECQVLGSSVNSSNVDHATVQLEFDNGTIGHLTASHVTSAKIRTLDVVTDGPYINLDYQQQDVTIQRTGMRQTTRLSETTGFKTETITETPYVGTREPLKNELEHFVNCSKISGTPDVDGKDGLEAVRLATAISEALQESESGTGSR